jgi:DNA-binding transcriptional LysR family regulator
MPKLKLPAKRAHRPGGIDSSLIAEAIAVADHRSFRRAAHVLGMHQSVVSRHVQALEDRIGVSLFERDRTGARLTTAGTRFLQEAREAIGQLENAVTAAGAAGQAAIGQLRIGIGSSLASGYLRDLLQAYRARRPQVNISIIECPSDQQVTLIRQRLIDVAVVVNGSEISGCDAMELWRERVLLILPRDHLLKRRQEVEWDDIQADAVFISEIESYLLGCLKAVFSDHNRRPTVRKLDVCRDTLVHLIALGLGIGATIESTAAIPVPGVVFRPIAGSDNVVQFRAIWMPVTDNPALRSFLSLARSMAKK